MSPAPPPAPQRGITEGTLLDTTATRTATPGCKDVLQLHVQRRCCVLTRCGSAPPPCGGTGTRLPQRGNCWSRSAVLITTYFTAQLEAAYYPTVVFILS